ncbi:hypothetical protein EB796_023609 [Bugula neritina]|uniref:Uncharacterized protein n=1 Tax=Bugula neritina TaxID=10212 RepID=A0A7J7IW73_BUGNE|nr:hypothetical protein EB796_023609 [Bugula neritina]
MKQIHHKKFLTTRISKADLNKVKYYYLGGYAVSPPPLNLPKLVTYQYKKLKLICDLPVYLSPTNNLVCLSVW